MKKKIILIITLIITLFFINSNDIYADAFCDKLEEKQGYTNLCQYIYIDGTLPITANLYIKNGETMIEWKCDTRNSNVIKEAKGICDRNTTQIINSTEGEKIIEGGKNGLFSRVYFHFYNYINTNSCPTYIYNYFGTISELNGNVRYYYKWLPTNNDSYKLDNATTAAWYKLELKTDCKNGSTEEPSVEPIPTTCEGLISDNLRELINKIMTYIRIAVPILLVGLIIVDFATAIFAESDDKMKKAQSKVIKRIIIAIVIFFVPTLINLLFNIVNDVWVDAHYEICGLDK